MDDPLTRLKADYECNRNSLRQGPRRQNKSEYYTTRLTGNGLISMRLPKIQTQQDSPQANGENKIMSDKEMPMAGNFGGTIMANCAGTWKQDKNNETLVDS